ncbi:MAG: hypothetical protein C3F12_05290 [Candidatus Methylomirabilota bacterium]|nr:MAG: hypothetical protein C3F12_05290 [candidate division NC10 bacterium]
MRDRRSCKAVRITVGVVFLSALLWACGRSTGQPGIREWFRFGFLGGQIWSLAIDPATPTTLYVGTWLGGFKSTDGGVTWGAR